MVHLPVLQTELYENIEMAGSGLGHGRIPLGWPRSTAFRRCPRTAVTGPTIFKRADSAWYPGHSLRGQDTRRPPRAQDASQASAGQLSSACRAPSTLWSRVGGLRGVFHGGPLDSGLTLTPPTTQPALMWVGFLDLSEPESQGSLRTRDAGVSSPAGCPTLRQRQRRK